MLLLAVVAVCGVSMACYPSQSGGSADSKEVSVNRSVKYFSKVEMYSTADVRFVQGKKVSVRVVGTKAQVDNLETVVSGETLQVRQKSGASRVFNFNNNNRLTVYVTSPDLTAVSVMGSGDFGVPGNIDTDRLDVDVKGSGDVRFMGKVLCDAVSLTLMGSGDIKAKSIDSKSAVLDGRGSGDIDVESLRANTANVVMRGSGDIDTHLYGVAETSVELFGSGGIDVHFDNCGTANCQLTGSGDIELEGTLGSLTRHKTGSGDIKTGKLSLRNVH